jgi:hypothetical protein
VDTKYKQFFGRPEDGDQFQMVTYCHTLSLPRGVLIYADDHPIPYRAQFKDILLDAQSLPLHGNLAEFQERCRVFASQFQTSEVLETSEV